MPSCDRFYQDLYACLLASECVKTHHKPPQYCLDILPKYTHDSNLNNTLLEGDGSSSLAPLECRQANRLYAECKLNMASFSIPCFLVIIYIYILYSWLKVESKKKISRTLWRCNTSRLTIFFFYFSFKKQNFCYFFFLEKFLVFCFLAHTSVQSLLNYEFFLILPLEGF